jgi:hypothetical protein
MSNTDRVKYLRDALPRENRSTAKPASRIPAPWAAIWRCPLTTISRRTHLGYLWPTAILTVSPGVLPLNRSQRGSPRTRIV